MIDLFQRLDEAVLSLDEEIVENIKSIVRKDGSKYQICIKTGELRMIEKFKNLFEDLKKESREP